jgi:hypothetical protein
VAYARQHGAQLADWYAGFLTSPLTASLASKAAISLELFLAVGLWVPRLRAFALWAGVVFHLMIQASARVELFSWLMGVAYVAFVTPELRERTVRVNAAKPLGRTVAFVVPWLDWLARFRLEAQPTGEGSAVVAVDRDGREATGLGVLGALGRGLPVVYLAWPLLAVLGRSRPRLTDP